MEGQERNSKEVDYEQIIEIVREAKMEMKGMTDEQMEQLLNKKKEERYLWMINTLEYFQELISDMPLQQRDKIILDLKLVLLKSYLEQDYGKKKPFSPEEERFKDMCLKMDDDMLGI